MWSADGSELFYVEAERRLVSVPIDRDTAAPGAREVVFEGPYDLHQLAFTNFDLDLDGSRFVVIRSADPLHGGQARPEIVLVQNWATELRRAAPTS